MATARQASATDVLLELAGQNGELTSRNEPEYLAVIQLAEEMTARLPAAAATAYVADLRSVRSNRFIIRAVPEEMHFDTPRIVVEAGKQFIITFENPDAMPRWA